MITASIGYGVVAGTVTGSTALTRNLMGLSVPVTVETKTSTRGRYGQTAYATVHRLGTGFGHGWMDLQIDVLREGVAVANSVQGTCMVCEEYSQQW